MIDLTKAKKYDCPIKMEIIECDDYGDTVLMCSINGVEHIINNSCWSAGDSTSFLIDAVSIYNWSIEKYLIRSSLRFNECSLNERQVYEIDIDWDDEGPDTWFYLRVNEADFEKDDFIIELEMEFDSGETRIYRVQYRDLCYAVAKCFTDLLKKYGIFKYRKKTMYDYIDIERLIGLKAYALGLIGRTGKGKQLHNFSFDQELELLNFDM